MPVFLLLLLVFFVFLKKLKRCLGRRAKFLFSWTSGTCWSPWKRSSNLKKPSKMPNQSFSQVGHRRIPHLSCSGWYHLVRHTCLKHSPEYVSFKTFLFKVGGGLPVVQKQASVQKKPSWQQGQVAHNPLDSTCPMVKKGKQREVPKAKKPTPLKKVSPLTSKQIQKGYYQTFITNVFQQINFLLSSCFCVILRSFWRRGRRGSTSACWRREVWFLRMSSNLWMMQRKSSAT